MPLITDLVVPANAHLSELLGWIPAATNFFLTSYRVASRSTSHSLVKTRENCHSSTRLADRTKLSKALRNLSSFYGLPNFWTCTSCLPHHQSEHPPATIFKPHGNAMCKDNSSNGLPSKGVSEVTWASCSDLLEIVFRGGTCTFLKTNLFMSYLL